MTPRGEARPARDVPRRSRRRKSDGADGTAVGQFKEIRANTRIKDAKLRVNATNGKLGTVRGAEGCHACGGSVAQVKLQGSSCKVIDACPAILTSSGQPRSMALRAEGHGPHGATMGKIEERSSARPKVEEACHSVKATSG